LRGTANPETPQQSGMIASDADPYDLARFIAAQELAIDRVRAELRAGRKVSHWMWFVFPQIAGLGRSETARFYAIRSREEAVAYLAHPVLGPRLVECTRLINAVKGSTAEQILGHVDAMKFHSCMTLFAAVDAGQPEFAEALRRYFGGAPDRATLDCIQPDPGSVGTNLT
jgi:uncharacterized protein (DUF1810 family)